MLNEALFSILSVERDKAHVTGGNGETHGLLYLYMLINFGSNNKNHPKPRNQDRCVAFLSYDT